MTNTLTRAMTVATLTGFAASATGAGFEIPQRGIKEMGVAYGGNAAMLEDATAVGNNPAGLTRLEGTQFSGGITVLLPTFNYDVEVERELIEDVGGTVPSVVFNPVVQKVCSKPRIGSARFPGICPG